MHVQFKARPSALSAAHMAGRTTNISDTPLGSSIHHTGLTHGLALSGTITASQKSNPPASQTKPTTQALIQRWGGFRKALGRMNPIWFKLRASLCLQHTQDPSIYYNMHRQKHILML